MTMCTIEKIHISENPMPHDLVGKILKQPYTALVAVGSLACIRTLWFRAYQLGKIDHFFGKSLSETEYALGTQIDALKECISDALLRGGIRHIIVYASCLEVVTMCDLEEELSEMDMPENVSLHILYRGPLAKRNGTPGKMLDRILEEIKMLDIKFYDGNQETDGDKNIEESMNRMDGKCSAINIGKIPPLPDFAGLMMALKNVDCDVLLLSPGGCKSCIEETLSMVYKNDEFKADFYVTRFDDISISQGCKELYEVILKTFMKERPLYLVGSAVFYMIGFDVENLVLCLKEAGKHAVWMESNGFSDDSKVADCIL